MNAIEELSKYGAVRTCKIVKEEVVTIVLTDGFEEDYTKTCEFLSKCKELFTEFPKMETCVTELNCAIVVLTK